MSRSTDGTARSGFPWDGTAQSCPSPGPSSTCSAAAARPVRRLPARPMHDGGGTMRALVCDLSVPRQVVSGLLGRVDKRFFFGPFSPAALKEIPDPTLPADDWVVLATRLFGLCGGDYTPMFLNGSMDNPMTAIISFPQVLGHEVVGTIVEAG